MTHGGLNSLQEAIFHGVPVLGLPLGSDQNLNIGRAIQDGYALKLEWTDITEETLSLALDNLLNDPKYSNYFSSFTFNLWCQVVELKNFKYS